MEIRSYSYGSKNRGQLMGNTELPPSGGPLSPGKPLLGPGESMQYIRDRMSAQDIQFPEATQGPMYGPAEHDPWLEERQDLRDREFMQSMQAGVAGDPEFAAEVSRLSIDLGLDPLVIKDNIESARRAMAVYDARKISNARTNPILTAYASSPRFAAMAHDDLDQLSLIENWGRQWDGGRLEIERGEMQWELMDIPKSDPRHAFLSQNLETIDEHLSNLPHSDSFLEAPVRIFGQMSKTAPYSFAAGAVAFGGLTLLTGGAGAVAVGGSMVASSVVGARMTAVSEGGNAFRDYTQAGMDPQVAYGHAVSVAWKNGAVELFSGLIPGGQFAGAAKNLVRKMSAQGLAKSSVQRHIARAAGHYAMGQATELLEESIQEINTAVHEAMGMDETEKLRDQVGKKPGVLSLPGGGSITTNDDGTVSVTADVYERYTGKSVAEDQVLSAAQLERFLPLLGSLLPLERTLTDENYNEKLWEVVVGTMSQTIRGSWLVGAAGPVALFSSEQKRAKSAKHTVESVKKLSELAAGAKLSKRDSSMLSEFIEATLRGKSLDSIRIDKEDLSRILAEANISIEAFDEVMPGTKAQYEASEEVSPDIIWKPGDFATNLEGYEVLEEVLDNIRGNEVNALSMKQLRDNQKEFAKKEKEYEANLSKDKEKRALRDSTLDSIEESQEAQLTKAHEDSKGRKPNREERAQIKVGAGMVRRWVHMRSVETGVDVWQIDVPTVVAATEQQEQQESRAGAELRALDFEQDADYTFVEADYRPEVVGWAREQFGDRMAPNGKLASENFTRWFGDSAVVDPEGKPLVVYHGSVETGLKRFDPRSAVEVEGGFFFSSNPDVAEGYRYERAYGDIIGEEAGDLVEASLSLKNPKRIKLKPGQVIVDAVQMGREIEAAKSEGHDGIIVESIDDTVEGSGDIGDTYVAFDPNQIKSTNNKGNFSADEDGILRQLEQPTRLPGGRDSKEDAYTDMTVVNFVTAMLDKKSVVKNAKLLREEMSFLRLKEGMSDEEVIEAYVEHVSRNLDWLYSQMSEEERERSRQWYVGGRKFVDKWADRYGIHPGQSAAIIAVLSPQKDWFVNMTMAERMLDIYFNAATEVISEEMAARALDSSKTPREAAIGERDVTLPKGYKLKDVAKEEAVRLGIRVPSEDDVKPGVNKQKSQLRAEKSARVESSEKEIQKQANKDIDAISKKVKSSEKSIKVKAAKSIANLKTKGQVKKDQATKIREKREEDIAQMKESAEEGKKAIREQREIDIVEMKAREVVELDKQLAPLNDMLAVPAFTVLSEESIASVKLGRDLRVAKLPSLLEGKAFQDVPVELQAYWVRLYDQTHNESTLRRLTPEGGVSGDADQTIQWTSYDTMAKVLSVLRDGSTENIGQQIGDAHKVRSFYNNLVAPWSKKGHLTIDTHAVAAGYLLGLSSSDKEVTQAWGGAGATSSKATGLKGVYAYLWEAYRRAAEKHGLLPREMQSITWEQVRALFGAEEKRGKLPDQLKALWSRYGAGEIEIDQVWEEVVELGGGFDPMFWDGIPADTESGRTYNGKSVDEGKPDVGRPQTDPVIGVEAKPNLNPVLLSEWESLTDEQRAQATQEILERVVHRVARQFGTNILPVSQRGGWKGDGEASIGLIVDDPEQVVAIADAIGEGLYQEGMFILSPDAVKGLEQKSAISITLPVGTTTQEIDQLYTDVIWPTEINGERVAIGHSTTGNYMLIAGLDSDVADQLRAALDDKLDDTYETDVIESHSTLRSHALAVEDGQEAHYGNQSPTRSEATGQPSVEAGGTDQSVLDQGTEEGRFDDIYREVFANVRGEQQRAGAEQQAGEQQQAGAEQQAGVAEAQSEPAHRMQHRPPGPDTHGAPLHDLTVSFPEDVYGRNAQQFYGSAGDVLEGKLWKRLQSLRGKPDAQVTIYRAVPKSLADAEIGPGDWVALGRGYAEIHGEGPLDGDYVIIEKEVRADEVFTSADSIQEAGYYPQQQQQEDTNLRAAGEGTTFGQFDPKKMEIILFKRHNIATFFHEFAHFHLEMLTSEYRNGRATKGDIQDLTTIALWAGYDSLEDYAKGDDVTLKKDIGRRRKAHEAFAYSFEKYLYTGEAPTTALKKVFRRIATWFKEIYGGKEGIKNRLNLAYISETGDEKGLPALTPEVRAVMDRLVASEEEIDNNLRQSAIGRVLEQLSSPGMTGVTMATLRISGAVSEEDLDLLGDLLEDAAGQSKEFLRKRLMKDLEYLRRFESRELQKIQAKSRKVRKAVEASEREGLLIRERAARLQHWLNTGEILSVSSTAEEGPVLVSEQKPLPGRRYLVTDDERVERKSRRETDLAEGSQRFRPMGESEEELANWAAIADRGDPEFLAETFGFESVDQMFDELHAAPDLAEEIHRLADEEMAFRFGDLNTPEAMAEVVRESLNNEAMLRLMESSARAELMKDKELGKKVKGKLSLMRAAKEVARRVVSKQTLGGLQPMAKRYSDEADSTNVRAMEEKDPEKKQSLLRAGIQQRAIAVEAYEARADDSTQTEKLRDRLRDRGATRNKTLAKTYGGATVATVRSVLSMFGLDVGSKKRIEPGGMPWDEIAKANDDEVVHDPLVDDLKFAYAMAQEVAINVGGNRMNMTVQESSDLNSAMTGLLKRGRESQMFILDNLKAGLDELVEKLKRMNEARGTPPAKREARERSGLESMNSRWQRLEPLLRALDGNKSGILTQNIWDVGMSAAIDLNAAEKVMLTLFDEALAPLRQQMKDNPKLSQPIQSKYLSDLTSEDNGTHIFRDGKSDIIGMLLHLGNKSNRERLVAGWGWDDDALTRQVNEWEKDGTITKADWDMVRSIWAIYDTMLPQTRKAFLSIEGYSMPIVERGTVKTQWGEIEGGYVPAAPDTSVITNTKANQQKLDEKGNWSSQLPVVQSGMTKERVEGAPDRALDLNLFKQATHFHGHLLYAHMGPALARIRQFVDNKKVRVELERMHPFIYQEFLNPWMETVGTQSTTMSKDKDTSGLDWFASHMRRSAGTAAMFANVKNSLQNISGIVLALNRVGPTHLLLAFGDMMGSPRATNKAIYERSKYMKFRHSKDSNIYEVRERVEDLLLSQNTIVRGGQKASAWMARNTYWMQEITQKPLDRLVWVGAYKKEMESSGDEEQAILAGDAAVRQTQGDTMAISLALGEKGTSTAKMFTQFLSWFIMMGSLRADFMVKQADKSRLAAAAPVLMSMFVTMVIGEAITEALDRFDGEEEDEKEKAHREMGTTAIRVSINSITAPMRMFGPLGAAGSAVAATIFNMESYQQRMPTAPAWSVLQRALRKGQQLVRGEEAFTTPAVLDYLDAMLVLAGAGGATAATKRIRGGLGLGIDLDPGEEAVDWSGLITGRR